MNMLTGFAIGLVVGWFACDLFDEDRSAAWAWVKAKWNGFFSKEPK